MFSGIEYLCGWESWFDCGFWHLHDHNCFEIVHHPTGMGSTDIDSWGSIDISPGVTVIYPPNFAHSQTLHTSGLDMVIHFTATEIPEIMRAPLKIESGEALGKDFEILSAPPAKRTALQQQALDYRLGAVLCRLFEIASIESPKENDADNAGYAEIAYRLIRENYNTIEQLSEVAEKTGISYDYLRHLFRERYGRSLQDALISARINRAVELLKHSTLPLKAISAMCGFGSDKHMCNVFNKRVGRKPSYYRGNYNP